MPKLTKRVLDEARASDSETILWDESLRGFGVRLQPSGVKSFLVQYRNAGGRSRRLTLGRYGVLTVDEARKRAREVLVAVAKGGDPVADKQSHRAAPIFSELVKQYLTDHVEMENTEKTAKEIRRLLKRDVLPRLGSMKAANITRNDVLKLHRSMKDRPRMANVTLSVLSKIFNLAEIWSIRPEHSNPCRGVPRYKEFSRERFLNAEELGRLGRSIALAESEGLPWVIKEGAKVKHLAKDVNAHCAPICQEAINIIRLLLFTGARRGEILSLRWEHVDLEGRTIALPDQKGGARRAHPVSSAAIDLLKGITAVDGSPWVFPRPLDKERHVTAEVASNAWRRIRHHAELDDVHLHDLRHTVGTYAGQAGVSAFIVRDLLRHTTTLTTNRYVNRHDDPLRDISDHVGERILAGLSGVPSGKVISLKAPS